MFNSNSNDSDTKKIDISTPIIEIITLINEIEYEKKSIALEKSENSMKKRFLNFGLAFWFIVIAYIVTQQIEFNLLGDFRTILFLYDSNISDPQGFIVSFFIVIFIIISFASFSN